MAHSNFNTAEEKQALVNIVKLTHTSKDTHQWENIRHSAANTIENLIKFNMVTDAQLAEAVAAAMEDN